jgi:hypothetical protein
MDSYTLSTSTLNAHKVEIYTSSLILLGTILGPFQRTSDLVNRRDREYLILEEASLSLLGQVAPLKPISESVFVPRVQVHMISAMATTENTSDPQISGPLASGSLNPASIPPPPGPLTTRGLGVPAGTQRQLHISRIPTTCYILTSTFVISGTCHLLEGATIEHFLDAQDNFFPLTKATIHLHSLQCLRFLLVIVVLF